MNNNNKVKEGKNGLRNYGFERVKKGKRVYLNDPRFPGLYQEWTNFFYTKECLYCEKEFESKRVDTSFCSQSCQKAHLRLRKNSC